MIPMLPNFELLDGVNFIAGRKENILACRELTPKFPFDEEILQFLQAVSSYLMNDKEARKYSDVITFAYWIRKASLQKLKTQFVKNDGAFHIGRGIAFHIAPSNVPVNFAYSLTAGLLFGNGNIVRVSSKDFPQVDIISAAFRAGLIAFPQIAPYVTIIRYERDRAINDLFSALCNVRVLWGGDNTIAEIRKSPLQPRAVEITFADRYSLAVIDSTTYLSLENKKRLAEDFYNDTYFSDQNACTSPFIVIWIGNEILQAKKIFWNNLHQVAQKKYNLQAVKSVDKLTAALMAAANLQNSRIEPHKDNLIIRVTVDAANIELVDYRENCGFFFEYDCKNILELKNLCNDTRCQTIGYIGNKEIFLPLIKAGVNGVDRIVPIGRTMDFELIWDGYELGAMLTRIICIE